MRWKSLVLLCVLGACSDDDDASAVLVDADAGQSTERQRRMNIKVEALEPGTDGEEVLTEIRETLPDAFGTSVAEHCQSLVVPYGAVKLDEASATAPSACSYTLHGRASFEFGSKYLDPMGQCEAAFCMVQWKLCEAHRLMEIAEAPGYSRVDRVTRTVDLEGATLSVDRVRERVGPQSSESKARLTEMAFDAAGDAAAIAADIFRGVGGLRAPFLSDVSDGDDGNPYAGACAMTTLKDDTEGVESAFFFPVADLGWASSSDYSKDRRPMDEALASALVEATYVAEEAATRSAEYYAGVGDAEYSRSIDISESSKLAWTDGESSRARGAHILVGGNRDEGLHYLWDEGFCPVEEPGPAVDAAIDMIRKSAASPRAIFDLAKDSRLLLEGGNGVAGEEALAARLAIRLGRPELASLDADALATEFGTDVPSITAARKYLKHEARAFGRDLDAVGPPSIIGMTQTAGAAPAYEFTSTPNYVATASPPTPPPYGYYVGLVRYSSPWALRETDNEQIVGSCTEGCTSPGCTVECPATDWCDVGRLFCVHEGPQYPRWHRPIIPPASALKRDRRVTDRGLIHLIDYVASAAFDLTQLKPGRELGQLRDPVLDVLATLGSTLSTQRSGRLEVCSRAAATLDGTDTLRFRLLGAGTPADYRIVKGVSGLRCAVEGAVEGAPCELDEWTLVPAEGFAPFDPRAAGDAAGFARGVAATVEVNVASLNADWVYVVKRRPGSPDLPGGYVQFGGTRLWPRERPADLSYPSEWDQCVLHPVVPEFEALAADLITPSTDNCSKPKTSCTGFDFADRVPLENELTGDGDGIESSWRRYLDLALDAADHADQLGEQLIEFGLQIDDRIEVANEELAETCGCPINIRDTAWGGVSRARGTQCDVMDPQACADQPGYACMGGTCVANLDDTATLVDTSAGADSQCLASCLGNDTVQTAALGDRDVCMWRHKGGGAGSDDPGTGTVCDPIPGISRLCPFAVDEGESCAGVGNDRVDLPANYEWQKVDKHLGIFHTIGTGWKPQAPYSLDCSDIRALRKAATRGAPLPAGGDVFTRVHGSNGLRFSTVQNIASRVGWRAYPDDYSAITFDGQTKWTTGNPFRPGMEAPNAALERPRWPCYGPHDWTFAAAKRVEGNLPLDRSGRMDPSASLFTTFTSGCDEASGPGRNDRIAMNHRMARAVLALKIAAGVPLDGFEAPYQPVARDFAWLENEDNKACTDGQARGCDYKSLYWALDAGRAPEALWGGRILSVADGPIRFHLAETEGRDSQSDHRMEGRLYCWPGNSGGDTLWTHLFDPGDDSQLKRVHGNTFTFSQDCHLEGAARRYDTPGVGGYHMPFVVHHYPSMNPDADRAAALWRGLDDAQAKSGVGENIDGLLYKKVLFPKATDGHTPSLDDILISRSDKLTDYFDFCDDPGKKNRNSAWSWCKKYKHPETFNRVKIASEGLTRRDLWDGLELMCMVANEEEGGCGEPLTIGSFQDLGRARTQLKCIANDILGRAESMVVTNIPDEVIDQSLNPDTYKGTRGEQTGDLVAGFIDLNEYQRAIVDEIGSFSDDIGRLRLELRKSDISSELSEINANSNIASQMAACASASQAGAGGIIAGDFNGAAQAAIACGNAMAQVAFAMQTLQLEKELAAIDSQLTWNEFRTRFKAHHSNLESFSDKLRAALHSIQAATAGVETQRQSARRSLAKGMLYSSEEAGNQFATNAVMRARYNTALLRYKKAVWHAKRMAHLARRSLEQRLGMNLSDIHEDLALVESPHSWVDELCVLSGMNYQDIASDTLDSQATTPDGETVLGQYADAYLGDYVRKLAAVFESYSINYPFTDGRDTAVVSLRDDIFLTRGDCEVPVRNLLANSASLDGDAWHVEGCTAFPPEETDCDVVTETEEGCPSKEPAIRDCVAVRRVDDVDADAADHPIPFHRQSYAPVDPFVVTFGGDDPALSSFVPRTADGPVSTVLAQRLELEPGTYRLSWRVDPAATDADAEQAVGVTEIVEEILEDPDTGEAVGTSETFEPLSVTAGKPYQTIGWPVHYLFFRIEGQDQRSVRVEVRPRNQKVKRHSVSVAALMLENIGGTRLLDIRADPGSFLPGRYIATTRAGTAILPACEDTKGEVFREGWRYGCEHACPTGAINCRDPITQCYWERTVDLPLESIENRSRLSAAGFAFSNFNYRTETLGLNFVGTNTRRCVDSTTPSQCYAGGFIPYSIYHVDGFDVRNHEGDRYRAPLFTGAIEHARGLASERYLSNPISTADRALIEPYLRNEFRGRPLAGTYKVRIWDTGEVNFSAIEDIQLVLGYRYWTHND